MEPNLLHPEPVGPGAASAIRASAATLDTPKTFEASIGQAVVLAARYATQRANALEATPTARLCGTAARPLKPLF